jgi:hypothetical protein
VQDSTKPTIHVRQVLYNTDCEYSKTRQLIIRLIKTHLHRIYSPLRTYGKIPCQHGVQETHPILSGLFNSASDNHGAMLKGAYWLTVYAPAVMEPAKTHTI